MYRKCRAALSADGLLISADCCPSTDPGLAALERDAWRAHLQLAYPAREAEAFFAAWAEEDVYFTLQQELTMLCDAAFAPDVVWRVGPMACIAARPL